MRNDECRMSKARHSTFDIQHSTFGLRHTPAIAAALEAGRQPAPSHRVLDRGIDGRLHPANRRFRQPAGLSQTPPRQRQRIVLLPSLRQRGGNVKRLVVGRVAAEAAGIAFQQHGRGRIFHRVQRLADSRVDGPRIGAVDPAAGNAVASRAVAEPPAIVLHAGRRGKCVMVVSMMNSTGTLAPRPN